MPAIQQVLAPVFPNTGNERELYLIDRVCRTIEA